MNVRKKRLLAVGTIVLILLSTGVYVFIAQSQSDQPNQNEAAQNPGTPLTGTDSEGNPMPESQKAAIYSAGTRAAVAYFTYSPFESPTARKARLQDFFTKESAILTKNELPPFASKNKISATISGQTIVPISKGQGPEEKNMRIDVELVESNANNEFVSSETSAWIVFLKGSNTSWSVDNILPIDSEEITPMERTND